MSVYINITWGAAIITLLFGVYLLKRKKGFKKYQIKIASIAAFSLFAPFFSSWWDKDYNWDKDYARPSLP